MSPKVRMRWALAAAATAALSMGAPVRAQDYDYDARVRIGGFFPFDLPTKEGTLWSVEIRDFMNARNGITYQIGYFNEQRTEFMTLNTTGGPAVFTFHAEVKLQPLLFSYFHVWPLAKVDAYAGVGAGFYSVRATSAGLNRQLGVGVKDVGDFRFLEDGTQYGMFVYSGVDFFPESRFGIMIEGRGHLVSQGYSAAEVSTGAIFRF